MTKEKDKLEFVSEMRVMAMTMIIVFHSMLFYTGKWWQFDGPKIPLWKGLSALLNAIDLPMFVFISGFLFAHLFINKNKYRNKAQFIVSKAQRLLIPYLLWGIFLVIAMPSLNTWGNLFTGICHLWFLLMLFDVFLLIIWIAPFLCQQASPTEWLLVIIGAVASFCLFHTYSTHHFFLCIHSALSYLPGFLLGMCCARYRLQNRMLPRHAFWVLMIALGILAFHSFRATPLPFFADYAIKFLTGYSVVFCICVILCKSVRSHETTSAVISHFDKLSMGIYIFNQMAINAFLLLPGTVPFLCKHYYIGVAIIFLVGSIIPWLLSMLFNRFTCLKWTIG